MEVDHDLVVVDEFDALAIEVHVAPKPASPVTGRPARPQSQEPPLPAPDGGFAERPNAVKTPSSWDKLKLKQQQYQNLQTLIDQSWQREKEKLGKFPAKTHARKVAQELGVKTGFIYLPGQEEILYEDSDMNFEFRQRRYFYYLSGAEFAGCAATYDIARDNLILWIPFSDPRTVLWFGTTPGIEECKAKSEVDDVRFITSLDRWLYLTLSPGSTLYVLDPTQAPKLQNTKGVVHIDSANLKTAIDAARVVKTDYEVAMIRRANAVSSAAHTVVMRRLTKLSNEREIDAIFRGFSLSQGAKHQAYPPIAGSGANAGTLHYWQNDEPLAGRQLVVIDAGAEWDCYASDVTRTLPISGKFTSEGAAIYAIVQRMQNECIERIKPGLVFYTLHLHACIVAINELLKLGILHGGTAAEIFARGTVSAFFPHGLGHHVGLEVHDVSGREKLMLGSAVAGPVGVGHIGGPTGRRMRGAAGKREWMSPEMLGVMYRDAVTTPPPYKGRQKLEKNMIVTVEPGIYFCREYIKAYFLANPLHAKYINTAVLENYYAVGGVRIEDCILVTEDGHENLTSAPKGEDALKIINES